MVRSASILVLLCLAAGCAPEPATGAVGDPAPTGGGAVDADVASADTVPRPDGGDAATDDTGPVARVAGAGSDWRVSVSVTAEGFGGDPVEGELIWEGDPAVGSGDGVFGRFGACAGWRDRLGAYSVVVSGGTGTVRSVTVWTPERVTGAGTYDAEVRLEADTVIVGAGTVEIDDDLRHGRFSATGADGGRLDGTFECAGSPSPVPLGEGADDGRLDTVEVFALVRRGDSERVLGFVTDAGPTVECPGTEDGVLVAVAGDERLGSITSFSASGEPDPQLRFEAGGVVYDVPGVDLLLDEGAASGVFAGVTADGDAVDGAFRCT